MAALQRREALQSTEQQYGSAAEEAGAGSSPASACIKQTAAARILAELGAG
jgi:hypothetical protein